MQKVKVKVPYPSLVPWRERYRAAVAALRAHPTLQCWKMLEKSIEINHVLPPLLGAAKARLGARSRRMRKWVESEPCGRSPDS